MKNTEASAHGFRFRVRRYFQLASAQAIFFCIVIYLAAPQAMCWRPSNPELPRTSFSGASALEKPDRDPPMGSAALSRHIDYQLHSHLQHAEAPSLTHRPCSPSVRRVDLRNTPSALLHPHQENTVAISFSVERSSIRRYKFKRRPPVPPSGPNPAGNDNIAEDAP
ncbi:hypothetical protein KP509_04G097700 [Ceratopteris richardii]|uniref:Transmembrane protein n=1 Tax=Ceratopteris richardii TaxID=49495 RepID=A0A8T2V383_CERRI|nr:hypothetical protein KP509_04G097700 [Ceratopteris richardii]